MLIEYIHGLYEYYRVKALPKVGSGTGDSPGWSWYTGNQPGTNGEISAVNSSRGLTSLGICTLPMQDEKKGVLQTIVEPQRVCSYRWAFSAPLVQKNLFFSPMFFATGQVGQMHPFSSEMHMKLFPIAQ